MGFEPTTSCLGSCLETSQHSLARPTACLLSECYCSKEESGNQALLVDRLSGARFVGSHFDELCSNSNLDSPVLATMNVDVIVLDLSKAVDGQGGRIA